MRTKAVFVFWTGQHQQGIVLFALAPSSLLHSTPCKASSLAPQTLPTLTSLAQLL